MAATLSKFLSHIYTITIIFFTLLFVELIFLIRSFTRTLYKTKNHIITTSQYLNLIEEKNPTTCYQKNNNLNKKPSSSESESESKECAVCLSDFEDGEKVRILQKCKHTFHKDCLDKWLLQYLAATCPLCRTKVLPDEVVAKYKQQQQQQNLLHLDNDASDEDMIFMISVLHGSNVHRFF